MEGKGEWSAPAAAAAAPQLSSCAHTRYGCSRYTESLTLLPHCLHISSAPLLVQLILTHFYLPVLHLCVTPFSSSFPLPPTGTFSSSPLLNFRPLLHLILSHILFFLVLLHLLCLVHLQLTLFSSCSHFFYLPLIFFSSAFPL